MALPESRSAWLSPAILTLLGIPVFFYGLGSYGVVNTDEAIYHSIARQMLESGDWLRLDLFGEHRVYDTFINAPLHYWSRALMIAGIGDGPWSMRLLSATFGLLTVLLVYRFTSHLAGDAAGFLAGLVQLTTFHFVYWHSARTGEMEAVTAFLFIALALLFVRALERGGGFALHHLCLALLVNVKLLLLPVPLLAELLCFAAIPRVRTLFRGWLVAGLLILPIAFVWHIANAIAHWELFAGVLETIGGQITGEERITKQRGTGLTGKVAFYAQVLLVGTYPYVLAIPFAIVATLRRVRGLGERDGWWVAACFVAAILLFFFAVSKHYPWYVVPVLPFFSAFVGAWFLRCWTHPRDAGVIPLSALAIGVLIWLHVTVVDVNPFEVNARYLTVPFHWRRIAGVDALFGLPLTALTVLAAVRWARSRGYEIVRSVPRLSVACLLGIGLFRVAAPLQYVGTRSAMDELAAELERDRAEGRVGAAPIAVFECGTIKAHFHFDSDFWVVSVDSANELRAPAGACFLLFDRARHPQGPPATF